MEDDLLKLLSKSILKEQETKLKELTLQRKEKDEKLKSLEAE